MLFKLFKNIATSNKAFPSSMNPKELEFVDTVQREYKKCIKVDCTRCEYCMPCPFGVDIPENFSLYNSIYMYNDLKDSQKKYMEMAEEKKASSCKACGK